jgi:hypothetical protein
MVQNVLGPRAAADNTHPNNFPDNELPHLQKLSDMMWAMWEMHILPQQRGNLDFFMSLGINNPTSASIIRRALDSEGQALSTTPYRFDPTSDGGLAILGMWKMPWMLSNADCVQVRLMARVLRICSYSGNFNSVSRQ